MQSTIGLRRDRQRMLLRLVAEGLEGEGNSHWKRGNIMHQQELGKR